MQAFALTDKGKKRKINQDCVYESTEPVGPFPDLFLLADGMGGHRAGDYASRCFIETFRDYVRQAQKAGAVSVFENAIRAANRAILEKSGSDAAYAGMGTTCVAAVIEDGYITVANVGDSRLYVIKEDIDQITRDHSLVEELVAGGEIERDSEIYRNHKNIITRAVGVEEELRIDFFDETLSEGDYVLLCSDGLSNMVSDAVIRDVVKGNGSIREKCRRLIDLANENGGSDNISVVLVEYSEGGGTDA